MAEYESDSSVDDGAEGTETNVILGFASEKPSEGALSHLGGRPIWLDAQATPSAALARCKVCNSLMSLLLQLNADLPSRFPDDERRLHIFCCEKRQCSRKIGCVRAFREVKKHKPAISKQQPKERSSKALEKPSDQSDLGTALFGGKTTIAATNNANPFSTSSANSQPENPFTPLGLASSLAAISPQRPNDEMEPPVATFAEKLKISNDTPPTLQQPPSEPWPTNSDFPPPFPTIDLENDFEFLYPTSADPNEPTSGSSKSQYDADDSAANFNDKELFESDIDKTFLKFSDRLSHNPEQVLRYEFDGQPLLCSSIDAVASRFFNPPGKHGPVQGIPRCEKCGAKRVFECQLVPGAISVLEADDDITDLESGMEWGTIVVGVCANNCGNVGEVAFREEWVGIQWEERVVRK